MLFRYTHILFLILLFNFLAGKLLNHLSHSLAARGFLDSEEHAGFLYVRPTLQSLDGLPLPPQPFLFGLLILRAESPWARAFPLRLMLRLGAEYRCKTFSIDLYLKTKEIVHLIIGIP